MVVSVTTAASFSTGSATKLFWHESLKGDAAHPYDVSADGQRFVVLERVGQQAAPAVRVVENWFAEFRDREQD